MLSKRALAILGCFACALAYPASASGEHAMAPMLAEVIPAVVSISTEGGMSAEAQSIVSDTLAPSFVGSGSIIDAKKGLILTDYHIIAGAEMIAVTLSDGRSFEAQVVGSDADSDIAIVKIDARDLAELPMGDSDSLRVGDYVFAVGNPFGLGQTVTHGIVSALGRTGFPTGIYEGYIQTDAAINPGNSGGPLIDIEGRMVGINSAIIDGSGGSIGLGFAIPSAAARGIVAELIAHGEVRRGQLGIVAQNLTADLAVALHTAATKGAVVSQVLPGSAGELAGLTAGDVIVSIDGRSVADAGELRRLIGYLAPQTKIHIALLRDGRRIERDAIVTLKIREPKTVDGVGLLRSVTLAKIPSGSPAYGKVGGAAVISVAGGSAAAESGLAEGDVIVSVDNKPVFGPEQMAELTAKDHESLLLGVYRDDQIRFVVIRRRSS
jgi:Do/DeqQ family serine protease